MTLDGIMNIEAKYLQRRAASPKGSVPSVTETGTHSIEHIIHLAHGSDGTSLQVDSTKDDEKAAVNAQRASEGGTHSAPGSPVLDRAPTSNTVESLPLPSRVESGLLDVDPASVGITSHTDIFIHSGTRLCYGLLLLLFSMIENPMFNRILYSKCSLRIPGLTGY